MQGNQVSFGHIGNAKRVAPGPAFRLALLGDFSGRANSGVLETGAKLASRKPLKVDVDNLDDLLERLNVTVSVPVDEEGAVISVPINAWTISIPTSSSRISPCCRNCCNCGVTS